MTNWKKVDLIKNISITLTDGLKSATIFGNERNCVSVTVTFEGHSEGKLVDISGERFDDFQKVKLVDFTSGEELDPEFDGTIPRLIYKLEASKYIRIPFHDLKRPRPETTKVTENSSQAEPNGKATFYVYGRAKKNFSRQIGVMFVLNNGKSQDTTSSGLEVCKVDLEVFAAIEHEIKEISMKRHYKHLSEEEVSKMRGEIRTFYDIYGNGSQIRLI